MMLVCYISEFQKYSKPFENFWSVIFSFWNDLLNIRYMQHWMQGIIDWFIGGKHYFFTSDLLKWCIYYQKALFMRRRWDQSQLSGLWQTNSQEVVFEKFCSSSCWSFCEPLHQCLDDFIGKISVSTLNMNLLVFRIDPGRIIECTASLDSSLPIWRVNMLD